MRRTAENRGIVVGAYGAVLAALLLLSSGMRGADTLPTQIADDDFWKLIESSSEPTGIFPSENFTSNETGLQMILPALQQAVKPGGVYLGVGPEQNFTYIAALQPRIVFIIDIRRQNLLQHLYYKAAFEMADNRADFLSLIFSRKRPDGLTDKSTIDQLMGAYTAAIPDEAASRKNLQDIKDQLMKTHGFKLSEEDQTGLERVHAAFTYYGPGINYNSPNPSGRVIRGGPGPGGIASGYPTFSTFMTAKDPSGMQRGFLASEENYRIVRELEAKNLLIPIVGDFGGPKALRAVGQYLKAHSATVSSYYTSNVEQYLFNPETAARGGAVNGGATKFYENVGALPLDAASIFVRSGVPSQPGGRAGGASGVNNSQIALIQATVDAYKSGKISAYADIFNIQ